MSRMDGRSCAAQSRAPRGGRPRAARAAIATAGCLVALEVARSGAAWASVPAGAVGSLLRPRPGKVVEVAAPAEGLVEPSAVAEAAMLGGPLPADLGEFERGKREAEAFVEEEPAESSDPVASASPGFAARHDGEPSARDLLGAPFRAVDPGLGAVSAGVSPAPTIAPSWQGIDNPGRAPSDSTGAVGPTRYVEVVNSKVAVYDRGGRTLASATLGSWWNVGTAASFDPQVLWDSGTDRFFYAGDAVYGPSDHRLAFGWSTSASPGLGTGDWCRYTFRYGSEFPDFPKLGDSADFLLIGVNVFAGDSFRGADVVAIAKPAPGPGCPALSTLKLGVGRNLSVAGARQFTPVPANQVDAGPNGWVVTVPSSGTQRSSLGIFRVTKSSTGLPTIQSSGTSLAVPAFSLPRNAPQSGSRHLLDSGDARLTQAVSAIDPLRGGRLGLWTQHTVLGGAGAAVRWYEIDPASRTLLQSGTVAPRGVHAFNGAISPDRVSRGSTRAFGSSMVLGFNTSSPTTFPSVAMVSKRGDDSVSAPVVVRTSPGPAVDFTCAAGGGVCRWGDYAAATPDPAASAADAVGRVWSSNTWTRDGRVTGENGTSWTTWNWGARP